MESQERKGLISVLLNLRIVLISAVFLSFPIFFLTSTSDFFTIPKYLLVAFSTIILLIAWAVQMVLEGKITVKSSPFNLPVLLFGVAILLSALFSVNRYDSLIQSVPVLMLILLFFVTINSIQHQNSFTAILLSLLVGGVLSVVISVTSYFKVYLLPFPQIQNQYFTTLGTQIQSLLFLLPLFSVSFLSIVEMLKTRLTTKKYNFIPHIISSGLLGGGIALFIYQIVSFPSKPILLPYVHGFQIALRTISQDVGRVAVSFLFGTGYGTFAQDFTRFRLASFNQEQNIWSLIFSFSSSYFLELIATTGILGVLSFLFLVARVIKTRGSAKNPIFLSVVLTLALSIFLPFSFNLVFLLFALLAIYTSYLYIAGDTRVFDVMVNLVAVRKGLLSFREISPELQGKKEQQPLLPVTSLIVVLIVSIFVAIFATRFFISDLKFTKSLQPATLNNGQLAYDLERQGIDLFRYRSDYYRLFSQLNLALANSLSNSIPAGSSPSAQTQQTILTLLQQSINNARSAIRLSPTNSLNWSNLAQIYRNLINVGRNSEQFSLASVNQAINLDPVNPLLYIQRGGIYYQLGQYDLAQREFQVAVSLKPDFTNAHYNLGHALESKGGLAGALQEYQIVRQLARNNKDNLARIEAEIAVIEKKIGRPSQPTSGVSAQGPQPPLELSTPSAQFPPQQPKLSIPPPPASPNRGEPGTSPTPTPTKTPRPTPLL